MALTWWWIRSAVSSAIRRCGHCREHGRFLVVGFASGTIPELAANQILLRNRTVLGVDWGAWAMGDPAANADLLDEVLAAVDHVHPGSR